MAELTVAAGTYGGSYARALVGATPKEHLAQPEKPKIPGASVEDLARIEHEMQVVEKDFLLLDETYGRNVMDLTLARTYLKKLLDNGKVVRYLAQKHRDVLAEFQRIVETASLDG